MIKTVGKLVGNKIVTVSVEIIEPYVDFNIEPLAEIIWDNIQSAIKAGTFIYETD